MFFDHWATLNGAVHTVYEKVYQAKEECIRIDEHENGRCSGFIKRFEGGFTLGAGNLKPSKNFYGHAGWNNHIVVDSSGERAWIKTCSKYFSSSTNRNSNCHSAKSGATCHLIGSGWPPHSQIPEFLCLKVIYLNFSIRKFYLLSNIGFVAHSYKK